MKNIFFIILSLFLISCQKSDKDKNSKSNTNNGDMNVSINAYARDSASGTREAFFSLLKDKKLIKDDSFFRDDIIIVNNNSDMITKIKNDINSLGYISFASLSNDIKDLKIDGIKASEDSILNGDYPLYRNFEWIAQTDITKDHVSEDQSKITKAFIAFIKSLEGYSILQSVGVITDKVDNFRSFMAGKYPVCSKDNSKVTIYFGGSTSVEKAAKALSSEFSSLCGNFIADHNHVGSSDVKHVADSFHMGFASRKLHESEIVLGSEHGILGKDGLVVVINKENNLVDNVLLDKLDMIFTEKDITFNDLN